MESIRTYGLIYTYFQLQTPPNKRAFVAVCSSYWNWEHICISESIINISPLRNQTI